MPTEGLVGLRNRGADGGRDSSICANFRLSRSHDFPLFPSALQPAAAALLCSTQKSRPASREHGYTRQAGSFSHHLVHRPFKILGTPVPPSSHCIHATVAYKTLTPSRQPQEPFTNILNTTRAYDQRNIRIALKALRHRLEVGQKQETGTATDHERSMRRRERATKQKYGTLGCIDIVTCDLEELRNGAEKGS